MRLRCLSLHPVIFTHPAGLLEHATSRAASSVSSRHRRFARASRHQLALPSYASVDLLAVVLRRLQLPDVREAVQSQCAFAPRFRRVDRMQCAAGVTGVSMLPSSTDWLAEPRIPKMDADGERVWRRFLQGEKPLRLAADLAYLIWMEETRLESAMLAEHVPALYDDLCAMISTLGLSSEDLLLMTCVLRTLYRRVSTPASDLAMQEALLAYHFNVPVCLKALHAAYLAQTLLYDEPLTKNAWLRLAGTSWAEFVHSVFDLSVCIDYDLDFPMHRIAAAHGLLTTSIETEAIKLYRMLENGEFVPQPVHADKPVLPRIRDLPSAMQMKMAQDSEAFVAASLAAPEENLDDIRDEFVAVQQPEIPFDPSQAASCIPPVLSSSMFQLARGVLSAKGRRQIKDALQTSLVGELRLPSVIPATVPAPMHDHLHELV